MPLHGTRQELDAYYYFYAFFRKTNEQPEERLALPIQPNVDIETLISKKKTTLEFINSVYADTFNAKSSTYYDEFSEKYDNFNDYIVDTISKYKKDNDELTLYEKSDYFVFTTGGYFIETKEGNRRNWVYNEEIEIAYETLKKEIKKLTELKKTT